jgi:hypothetical protein
MLRFRRMKSLQKFASVHAGLHNHFNSERHLVDRETYKLSRPGRVAVARRLKNSRFKNSRVNRRQVAIRLTALSWHFGFAFPPDQFPSTEIR